MKTKQKLSLVLFCVFSFFTGFFANNHGFDTKSMCVISVNIFLMLLYFWYFHIFTNSEGRANREKDTKTREWFVAKMGGKEYLLQPNWNCVHAILHSMSIRRRYQLRRGYMLLHAYYSEWGEFDSANIDRYRADRRCEIKKVISLIDKYLPPQKKQQDEEDED